MIGNEKIFVQIASYRDPELLPTIRDCIKKADSPENLIFCVAWQHSVEDEWDNLDEFKDDPRFIIIDIKHADSQGACWARALCQMKYTDEQYVLQLDSHHRFVRGWDTKCKQMVADLQKEGYKKPLLTAYLPSYDPADDPGARVKEVWKLDFDRFTPEGVIFMMPSTLEDWRDVKSPIPTRFLSAHFLFTLGEWNKKVLYDPNLYFHGEEITLAVRSYTHGYDLFTPNEIIAWHEYTRKGRSKHWDDNNYSEKDIQSLKRVKKILNVDNERDDTDFGIYGLGSIRTQKDYEEYAGIRFNDRAVQTYTLQNLEAPNPLYRTERTYEKSFVHRFKHCIDLWKISIDESIEHDGWVVAFENEKGETVYRQDADKNEIQDIKNKAAEVGNDFYNIWRIFEYNGVPSKWVIWPYSHAHGWGNKIEGTVRKI